MQVNKEAIRILVSQIGFTETSTRTGIKRDTLYKWGQRQGWKEPVQHAQAKAVQSVQSAGDAHAEALADLEGQTRITLARYARNAAGAVHKSVHPARYTKEAHDIAKTAAITHGWDAKREKDQANVAVNIAILNA